RLLRVTDTVCACVVSVADQVESPLIRHRLRVGAVLWAGVDQGEQLTRLPDEVAARVSLGEIDGAPRCEADQVFELRKVDPRSCGGAGRQLTNACAPDIKLSAYNGCQLLEPIA